MVLASDCIHEHTTLAWIVLVLCQAKRMKSLVAVRAVNLVQMAWNFGKAEHLGQKLVHERVTGVEMDTLVQVLGRCTDHWYRRRCLCRAPSATIVVNSTID